MLSNAYGHRRSPSLRTGPIHPPPGPPQLALHHPPSYSQIYGTLGNAPIIVPSETTAVRSLSCKLFSVESHSPEFKPKSSTVTNTTVPTLKRRGARTRSSSSEFGTFQNSKFFFTPASAPSYAAPSSPPPAPKLPSKKPAPPPLFRSRTPPYNSKLSYPYSRSYRPPRMQADSEDERDDDSAIYTSWREPIRHTKSSTHLRTRVSSVTALSRGRDKPAKCISTTPGHYGAGETETEIDEPPRHLPTSRIIPSSGPLIPPNTLQQRLTPLLFEFSRLLSIVPAIFGTLYNLYHVYRPPVIDSSTTLTCSRSAPERIDYLVSALWAILTGYQCLRLTTGLLTRWRLYYPPLPTLIRLLALQAICWPATHLTLTIFEHEKRPVIVWAIVGSTTCMSRSVQIWVTSNLWWETSPGAGGIGGQQGGPDVGTGEGEEKKGGYWKRWGGGKWGRRRWDWTEVGIKCVLPAGVVYCVMAWAQVLRQEWNGC